MEISNNLAIGKNAENSSHKKDISVDDFLKIMAAEIKSQNPMSGGESGGSSTSYISQLAQLTTLEQMTNISDSISLLTLMNQQQYSFSLIGKEVTLQDDNGTVAGIVDKIKFNNGYAMLQVNGKDYYLGSVVEVADAEVDK